MFSFKKERNDNSKSTIDKIVMGLIIGGAIGSVLGLSVAPEEGNVTREKIKSTTKVSVKIIKTIYEVFKKRFLKIINKQKKNG